MIDFMAATQVGIAAGIVGLIGSLSSYAVRAWGRRRLWLAMGLLNVLSLAVNVAHAVKS